LIGFPLRVSAPASRTDPATWAWSAICAPTDIPGMAAADELMNMASPAQARLVVNAIETRMEGFLFQQPVVAGSTRGGVPGQ
jgi:hypothetical protein